MNILDENIIEPQCQLLRKWRVRFRQIGFRVGREGMQDEEILALLHNLRQPTFFTRDDDFDRRELCHAGYCLSYLAVRKEEAALFIRRFLHHSKFNSKGKRMGCVVRISHTGLSVWRIGTDQRVNYEWSGQ